MSDIKPIETAYKGYRFRSRLEARWAVFFDALGLKWEYEKEWYSVYGTWYLPDFWLNDYQCFVEIKPDSYKGSGLCCDFRDITNTSIVLVCGPPWDYIGKWFGWDTCDSGGGVYDGECVIACPMALIIECERSDRTLFVSQWDTNSNVVESHAYTDNAFQFNWGDCKKFAAFRSNEAILKAKRARFEHGEHP